MTDPIWCVMPVLAGLEMTEAAISDVLAQSVPTKLLIINQGVDDGFREWLERIAEQESTRVYVWHHVPPLPSLSASWNLALDLAWQSGGTVALVVNNDVRLHKDTIKILRTICAQQAALFVSAVGVAADEFNPGYDYTTMGTTDWKIFSQTRGGPDFSCFLITRECHQAFPFDEHFIPAFCEDLDYHRRLMLAGEGTRIFSVNIPYLHYASQTLKALPEKDAQRIRQQIESVSRAYYARKWGGPVNAERFWAPFDSPPDPEIDLVMERSITQPTTPNLQAFVQQIALTPFLTTAAVMDQILEQESANAERTPLLHDRSSSAAGDLRESDLPAPGE
jgi:hypothetical protein